MTYAKEREQFARPIGSFQAVKHRCADMLVDVEGMRSAVYYAAWAIGPDQGDEASVAASTAKVWCSDAGLRVAESALQVHGGIGFTWESDVHLYLKRAQLDQVGVRRRSPPPRPADGAAASSPRRRRPPPLTSRQYHVESTCYCLESAWVTDARSGLPDGRVGIVSTTSTCSGVSSRPAP